MYTNRALGSALIFGLAMTTGTSLAMVDPGGSVERIDLPRMGHLFAAGYQQRMSRSPLWDEFLASHGEGWRASWDARTGVPRWIMGPGIQFAPNDEESVERIARGFIADHADLLRVANSDLRLAHARRAAGRWFLTFDRYYDGVPVGGARVDFRFMQDGRLTLIGADPHPDVDLDVNPRLDASAAAAIALSSVGGTSDPESEARLLIVPIADGRGVGYTLTWEVVALTSSPLGRWIHLIDAETGEIVARKNEIRYADLSGTIGGTILPVTPSDEPVPRDFAYEDISIDGEPDIQSDAQGSWSAEVSSGDHDVESGLHGLWVRVQNQAGDNAALAEVVPADTPTDLIWDDANSLIAERNVYYHTGLVHDYMKAIDGEFTSLDYDMPARVEADGACNAYWNGFAMTFFRAGGQCPSIAKIADVVYHEYGHGVTQWASGGQATGAMHEGFSDYLAVTIMNDSRVGRGFFGEGTHLRDCVNNRVYPANECGGETHCVGEAHCGALWDARTNLIGALGEQEGTVLSDSLWHYARYGHANDDLDYYIDYLLMDDDDGDLTNGTVHGELLFPALAAHGFVETIRNSKSVIYDADTPDLVADPGDEISCVVGYALPAGAMAATGLSASLRSLTPKLLVTKQSADLPDVDPGGEGDNSADPFLLSVDAGVTEVEDVQVVVELTANPNFFSRTDTLTFRIGRSNLLLVDDDPAEEFASYYETPLEGLGNFPNRWTRRDTGWLSIYPFNGFDTVIWFCGNAAVETLDEAERALLASYLDGGGNLFLSGQNIGEEIGSEDFFGKYLKSEFVNANSHLPLAEGVPGDELSNDWLLFFTGEGGANNWISPDVVRAVGGARDALFYSTTADGAGVVYEGDYKLVYLPFNFEGVSGQNGSTSRKSVLNDVLQFFGVPVGVRAIEIEAIAAPEGNLIRWRLVGAEADLAGVNVDRIDSGTVRRLNEKLIVGRSEYVDQGAHLDGIYRYRIVTVDAETGEESGSREIVLRRGQTPGIPASAYLRQNAPNPFNPSTVISFGLAESGPVTLAIYDLTGRRIAGLIDEELAVGTHSVAWDGRTDAGLVVPSGVYLYRLRSEGFTASRRMLLIK